MKITKEEAINMYLGDDDRVVDVSISGDLRWFTLYDVVFKDGRRFWSFEIEVSKQDLGLNDTVSEEVDCIEVEPRTKTVVTYKPI